jgi:hypothetical protein
MPNGALLQGKHATDAILGPEPCFKGAKADSPAEPVVQHSS